MVVRRHASGGRVYRVELAPRETGAGPDGMALTFTDEDSGAVLSAGVPASFSLYWATGSDLDELLARAS